MLGWDNFFMAEVGASASLAGLIFVGVSINMTRIISIPGLPNRAIQALAVLLTVLVVALLFLIPAQSDFVLGLEVILVGAVVWCVNTWIDVINYRKTEKKYKRPYLFNVFMDQICLVLYLIAGILIVTIGDNGVYLLVPATILSFLKAIIDAWVLLVEINR